MVWTPPMTAVNGDPFAASEYNTHIRDNLRETMPSQARDPNEAVANGGGPRWFVTATKNKIRARAWHNGYVDDLTAINVQVPTLNSYSDIPLGPIVPASGIATVRTGGAMIVILTCFMSKTTGSSAFMSFAVYDSDNNEVVAPDDTRAISTFGTDLIQFSGMFYVDGLEPERPYWVSTKYKVNGALTTDVIFASRNMTVIEL